MEAIGDFCNNYDVYLFYICGGNSLRGLGIVYFIHLS